MQVDEAVSGLIYGKWVANQMYIKSDPSVSVTLVTDKDIIVKATDLRVTT